jgi:hypothetical protein
MIKIKQQPIVTSSTDLHGDKIPLDVLKQFFEQLPDPWVLNNNHDLSKPPIGIGYNKQFGQTEDGVWAILIDVDVWDEEEFNKMGGFSISYLRNKITMNPNREGDIEIIFNPMILDKNEINELIQLSTDNVQIDAREVIQKALEIPFVLILKFSAVAFFAAFFGKMGSDTWDLLKNKITVLASKKSSNKLPPPVCQFIFVDQRNDSTIEVLVTVKVETLDVIENNREELFKILDEVLSINKNQKLKKIAICYDSKISRWKAEYCLTKDNKILKQ